MNKIIRILIIVSKIYSQNLIPNFNFQSSTVICQEFNDVEQFNNKINNWKIAEHNIEDGFGTPQIYDLTNTSCFQRMAQRHFCSNFQPPVSSYDEYKRILGIIAEFRAKKNKCKEKDETHEAVAVSLENGGKFQKNKDYVIRYKIIPTRSFIEGRPDTQFNCGDENVLECHIRFFLSEKGPKNWNKNSSKKMEILDANYFKNVSQFLIPGCTNSCITCTQEQVVKNFKPDDDVYTTIVILAENGGALIDEVEVFESCPQIFYIQNKVFPSTIYYSGAINGSDYMENANNVIHAGNNVTSDVQNGDVVILNTSLNSAKVIFQAGDEIHLDYGFEVWEQSEFIAEINQCNTNLRLKDNNQIDISNVRNNDNFKFSNVIIYPNPVKDNFEIKLKYNEKIIKKILIYNYLSLKKEFYGQIKQIDVSDLSDGLYYVELIFNDETKNFIPILINK